MEANWLQAIVRVFVNRDLSGVGFLASGKEIVTCDHNLGAQSDSPAVSVDFPFWRPGSLTKVAIVARRAELDIDIAILQVVEAQGSALPRPLETFCVQEVWGRKYRAYGCPEGQPDGVWSEGIVGGPQASGLHILESSRVTGYAVTRGFSGGPVLDPSIGGVLGVISGAERDPSKRTGFMIPATQLVNAWPVLKRWSYHEPQSAHSELDVHLFNIAIATSESLVADAAALADTLSMVELSEDLRSRVRVRVQIICEPSSSVEAGLADWDMTILLVWEDLRALNALGISPTWLKSNWHSSGYQPYIVLVKDKQVLLDPQADDFETATLRFKERSSLLGELSPAGGVNNRLLHYSETSDLTSVVQHATRLHLLRKTTATDRPNGRWQRLANTGPEWAGSPYPGLRPLTAEDRPIFFGREREANDVLGRLTSANGFNFVALTGGSGSGKSSLMAAGIEGALIASGRHRGLNWGSLKFCPGDVSDDVFVALALELHRKGLQRLRVRDLREQLVSRPDALAEFLSEYQSLAMFDRLVVYIDQFEELYSTVSPGYAADFLASLERVEDLPWVSVVVSLRADFFHRCLESRSLSRLLRSGTYTLNAPELDRLDEIVRRPAARAGLSFEGGLSDRIVNDAGADAGSLPLLAYTLAELYRWCCTSHSADTLSHAGYESIGGVRGAIGKRADAVAAGLSGSARKALSTIFGLLVDISGGGLVTKRKAPLELLRTNAVQSTVRACVEARLLVASRDSSGVPVLELAHEALLEHWTALREWVDSQQATVPRSGLAHEREMSSRRRRAVERREPGALFAAAGSSVGGYCWASIDGDLYDRYLSAAEWYRDKTPGMRTRRLTIGKEDMPVIFRLRGLEPEELEECVASAEHLICEFWPNTPAEGYRGINLIRASTNSWRQQDLIPSAESFLCLRLNLGVLWLDDRR